LLVVFNKAMNADTPADLDDALNVENYSLIQNGSTVITIDPRHLRCQTATLSVNGGIPLRTACTPHRQKATSKTLWRADRDRFRPPLLCRHAGPAISPEAWSAQPGGLVITDGGAYQSFHIVNCFVL
jgi:hypothetical protein